MEVGHKVAGVLQDPGTSPPMWNVWGAQYRYVTFGELMPADHVGRDLAVLDEVVGVRLEAEIDALPLEDRQQLAPSTSRTSPRTGWPVRAGR